MIGNIHSASDLRALARRKRQRYAAKSVPLSEVSNAIADGWSVQRQGTRSARVIRPKPLDVWLEDRVWTLLYRMGFTALSGERGATIRINSQDDAPTNQLDVVALDDEVALAVECKSALTPSRKATFQADLAKQGQLRDAFSRAVAGAFPQTPKRYVALAFFTENLLLGANDRKRAEENSQLLFDEIDLSYYEALTNQVGPAARYQFLAELLPGKRIPSLALRVPAVKARMGGYNCYTFAVSPEYLLKTAYISHRAKGRASDVNTYQRMMQKTRLRKIAAYISNNGIFPTNIVINLERSRGNKFDRAHQESENQDAEIGWLTLNPAYKSAWIIDGQHRLYAYSGHPKARRGMVSVLAFEGLPASVQARLFIDINAEQKSVKQTLLQELYSELHWDAADDEVRARAIISKAVLLLDQQVGGPLYQRILKSDSARTPTRCISLGSLFDGLAKTGIYFGLVKKGNVLQYGPLWAGENMATLARTVDVVSAWFRWISDRSNDWWDIGAGKPNGGLAMNDGVNICLDVLRSVFAHLDSRGHNLLDLDDHELVLLLQPFGEALGDHLGSLSGDQRQSFRELRGNQGKASGLRRCQLGMAERMPDFKPPGLDEWIELDRARTNERASATILRIEKLLQATVLAELKQEFGEDESEWWFKGIPKAVRKHVDDRINDDQGQRGGREENLDLIHYRDIATANWLLFQELLGYGKGSKDRKTGWIVDVNEIRKTAMHASRGAHAPVTYEQLGRLEDYERWLLRTSEDEPPADPDDDLSGDVELRDSVVQAGITQPH